MYHRFGFVFLVAALWLGAARAEYEDYLEEDNSFHRVTRHNHVAVDPNQRHRGPVVLPRQRPRPLVQIPENYPQEKLHSQHDVMAADGEAAPRVPRSIPQSSFRHQGPRTQPSPTFPRPRTPTRPRREAEVDDEPVTRHVRSFQPYEPRSRFPSPVPRPSPTFPRPGDINGPVLARFRRGGGRVSVDVEKNRGSKSTTRVTAEQNVYKSGDGRTRVDASGYATSRGDRGGMINFSHRF